MVGMLSKADLPTSILTPRTLVRLAVQKFSLFNHPGSVYEN
jgi:hypothetical protein